MLFHTWPFLVFMLVVLPVYFALRHTKLWIPWLMAASYFFYGWWNPYYLLLVFYSTVLDFFLVALMDHCPRAGQKAYDAVLKRALLASTSAAVVILVVAWCGPPTLRPSMVGLAVIFLLMAW